MSVLANALPGLRSVRSPLIVGYAWLLFGWLVAGGPTLDDLPAAFSADALLDAFGRTALLAVVSVIAYFVGSTSIWVTSALSDKLERQPPALGSLLKRLRSEAEGRIRATRATAHEAEQPRATLDAKAQELEKELIGEIRLPATLLLEGNPELFAEVDRLQAEGELRAGIGAPLVGCGVFLGAESDPWWLLLILAAIALGAQGITRLEQSRNLSAAAIDQGIVNSPSVSRFRTWMEQDLLQ